MLEHIRSLFFGNEEKKNIFENIIWLFFEKLFRYVVSFFVGVWVIRYLGPDRFGILSYAVAFTGIIGTFVGLGMSQVLTRELVKSPEKHSRLLSSALSMSFLSSFFISIVSIALIFLIRPNDMETIVLVAILSIAYCFRSLNLIQSYFSSQVKQKIIVPAVVTASFLAAALKVCLILYTASLYYFAGAIVFEQIILTIGVLYLFYKETNGSIPLRSYNKTTAKSLLKDSLPLMLSAMMIAIFMQIDQLMIRELIGNKEAGHYGVAVILVSLWYFIPGIITSSFFPKIIKSLEEDAELFKAQLQKLYNLIALLGYLIAIPVSLLATPIVSIIYGQEFAASAGMLSLLIWALLFSGLGIVKNAYIYAMNLTKIHLIITVLGAILNICLNLMLIPKYQGMGAVIATVISYSFTALFSNLFFKALRPNVIMMLRALVYPKIF